MNAAQPQSRDHDEQSPTTEKLSTAAHEAVDRTAETAARGEQRLREQTARAAEKAQQTEERIREVSDHWARGVQGFVQRNPIASAGIAFAAGMLLSSLNRR